MIFPIKENSEIFLRIIISYQNDLYFRSSKKAITIISKYGADHVTLICISKVYKQLPVKVVWGRAGVDVWTPCIETIGKQEEPLVHDNTKENLSDDVDDNWESKYVAVGVEILTMNAHELVNGPELEEEPEDLGVLLRTVLPSKLIIPFYLYLTLVVYRKKRNLQRG